MANRILMILSFTWLLASVSWGQGASGDLKGTVLDERNEPVAFGTVTILKDGSAVRADQTDIDGKYWIQGLAPGKYDVKIIYLGYITVLRQNVTIESGGKITFLDIKMSPDIKNLGTVEISDTKVNLLPKDQTMLSTTINKDDILRLPNRNPASAATIAPAVFSRDGEVGNIAGARQGATTIVDGVKIRGTSSGLPQGAVEEVQVVIGGQPAEFGDATGGLVLISTRNISNKFFGTIEARTSKFLDNWEDYLFAGTVGGPLIRKKMKDSTSQSVAGFLLTVEGNYVGNPRPVNGGVFRVKEDVRQRLVNEPLLLITENNELRAKIATEYLRANDFEKVPAILNVAQKTLNVQGKFDFRITPTTTLTVGGFVNLGENFGGNYNFSLYNWENNAQNQNFVYNIYGRLTQRFEASKDTTAGGAKKKGGVKGAQVTLQVDYLRGFGTTQDANHRNNFFDYGYIGKFNVYRTPAYIYGFDPKLQTSGFLYQGMRDTMIAFQPGTLNPSATAWTSQYYGFFNDPFGRYDQFTSIQNGGGLLNGQTPRAPYSIWSNVGTEFNGYSKTDNSQFRVVGNGSATIGDHSFKIGFEFEQRNDAGYSINPVGLWRLAYLLTNSHLGTIDTSQPAPVFDPTTGVYLDTINYPALYIEDVDKTAELGIKYGVGQRYFDRNLRLKLGLPADGLDFIDVDQYDPSFYSLNMFSPDELLNQGSNYVNYFGYDPYGNRVNDNISFEDFFIAKGTNPNAENYGQFTRPVAAFRPVYLAGYIMDKFSFKDIIFNVGVRIDRFDANQKSLKDRYSLYETRRAGEVTELIQGSPISHPGNIGNDYVVYVNDKENPTAVVGYRNQDQWYNAQGEAIADPTVLRTASGRVQPLMVNKDDDINSVSGFNPIAAFEDYKPQVNVMPRIGFSFPVSEMVNFTAYYDVLTQRPSGEVRLNPFDYYFWDNSTYNSGGTIFNNPSLRPERTTDFSLGFLTGLNEDKSIALKISAFYRELRDMIAAVRVTEAYPRTYTSWSNIDFGTVKGATFEFLIRKKTFVMNAAYTLQFADGTGSDNTSALNLVNSGQPNLRTTTPLNYDRRHLISVFAIYTFDDKVSTKKWVNDIFKSLGASLQLRGGSGVPYSRQSNITGNGLMTGGGQASLLGAINGARLPWEFTADMQFFKDFNIKFGKKEEGAYDNRKSGSISVYLSIENIFNIKNTLGVYAATGLATDDGYLTSAQFQTFINSQVDPQAFRDQYAMKVNNPYNFSQPRRMYLGVRFGF